MVDIRGRWLEKSTISKLQHSHFFIQSHPIINFSHLKQDQLQHHDQSKSKISQVVYYKQNIREFLPTISKIINWKEIMKFILLYLKHSLLLLLPIKAKQPPNARSPNYKNKPQYKEECFQTKISKISSDQLIIKPHL